MNVRLSIGARLEADEAAPWYDAQRAGLGDEFLDEVHEALEQIETRSDSFPELETNQSKRRIHRVLLKRFPYLVVFEFREVEIVVLAVAHGSRRPNYWKGRD